MLCHFKIIQNDITKITADIIVNTANPNPVYGSGTDYAIYKAAGKSQLTSGKVEDRKNPSGRDCGNGCV